MGAATALVLAGTYPDLPGAILLEIPPRGGPTGTTVRRRARRAEMRTRYIGLKAKTREELLAGQRAEQPGWSDAELEPWADAKQRFSPNVLQSRTRKPGDVDWPAILPRITCPALLITADPERGAIVTEGAPRRSRHSCLTSRSPMSRGRPQHPPRPVRHATWMSSAHSLPRNRALRRRSGTSAHIAVGCSRGRGTARP